MQVILFETVQNLGLQGATVKVKPGYFRNYLSPRGLAVEATDANIARLQDKLKQLKRRAEEEVKAARSEVEKLEGLTLTFRLKAGQEDKLFGSVTNADIAQELSNQGFEIDRHRIAIPEPIKRLGHYVVDAKVHHDIVAKVKVVVEKEEE